MHIHCHSHFDTENTHTAEAAHIDNFRLLSVSHHMYDCRAQHNNKDNNQQYEATKRRGEEGATVNAEAISMRLTSFKLAKFVDNKAV